MTLLAGRAEVEIDGTITPLEPDDTTYVKAGIVHCFTQHERHRADEDPLGLQLRLRDPDFADTGG